MSSCFKLSFVCVLLSSYRNGHRNPCKHLGCLAAFPSHHPTLDVGEQGDRFPSAKLSPWMVGVKFPQDFIACWRVCLLAMPAPCSG